MSRHKSFAKIWLAYWLVKPMVPCRKFLGRAKTHDSGARPPSDRAQPSGRTLTCKGSDLADWAASHPPCLAPPDGAGRGAQRARSPRSHCWGGTEPGASLRELMLPLPGLCAGVVAPRSRAAAAASASAICAAVGFVRAIWLPLAHDHRHDRQGSFSRLHAKHSTVCGPYAAPRLPCRWFQRLRASLKEGEGFLLLYV